MFFLCLQYIMQEIFDARLLILTWLQATGDVVETEREHKNAIVGSFEASSSCQHHRTFDESTQSLNIQSVRKWIRFWLAHSGCWRDCRACGPVGWMWAMVSQWGRHPATLHWANPPDQSAVCQAGIRVCLHRSLPQILVRRSTRVSHRGAGVGNIVVAWVLPHIQSAKVNVKTPWGSCYFLWVKWKTVFDTDRLERCSSDRVQTELAA